MHTKRMIAENYWKVGKKTAYWVATPRPGSHKRRECMPLVVLIRDVLKFAETEREAKAILAGGGVKLLGGACAGRTRAVGLMDVVSFTAAGKHYRIVPYKLGLKPVEIPEADAGHTLMKIVRKHTVKGKIQLTMHNGTNVLVDVVQAKDYATGDTVEFDVKTRKIVQTIKLEKGVLGLIFDGVHRGEIAKIVSVQSNSSAPDTATLEARKQKFDTLKDYVMVVGKTSPIVSLGDSKSQSGPATKNVSEGIK